MTSTQHELHWRRTTELADIAEEIENLKLTDDWIEVFTKLCFYRGWQKLTEQHLSQIENIASINSEAVLHLSRYGKKVGLSMLEDLSVKIPDEQTRLKAVQLIINKGVKPSKNELDAIIAEAESTRSLFDEGSQDE